MEVHADSGAQPGPVRTATHPRQRLRSLQRHVPPVLPQRGFWGMEINSAQTAFRHAAFSDASRQSQHRRLHPTNTASYGETTNFLSAFVTSAPIFSILNAFWRLRFYEYSYFKREVRRILSTETQEDKKIVNMCHFYALKRSSLRTN